MDADGDPGAGWLISWTFCENPGTTTRVVTYDVASVVSVEGSRNEDDTGRQARLSGLLCVSGMLPRTHRSINSGVMTARSRHAGVARGVAAIWA